MCKSSVGPYSLLGTPFNQLGALPQVMPVKLGKIWDRTKTDWPLAGVANRLKAKSVRISQQDTAAGRT